MGITALGSSISPGTGTIIGGIAGTALGYAAGIGIGFLYDFEIDGKSVIDHIRDGVYHFIIDLFS
jgi:hypothetical protein